MKNNTKDALGNEIILGNNYGYSITYAGVTAVKTGVALYYTNKGLVSLKVETHMKGVYNEELTDCEYKKGVSVKSASLFPINREIKM